MAVGVLARSCCAEVTGGIIGDNGIPGTIGNGIPGTMGGAIGAPMKPDMVGASLPCIISSVGGGTTIGNGGGWRAGEAGLLRRSRLRLRSRRFLSRLRLRLRDLDLDAFLPDLSFSGDFRRDLERLAFALPERERRFDRDLDFERLLDLDLFLDLLRDLDFERLLERRLDRDFDFERRVDLDRLTDRFLGCADAPLPPPPIEEPKFSPRSMAMEALPYVVAPRPRTFRCTAGRGSHLPSSAGTSGARGGSGFRASAGGASFGFSVEDEAAPEEAATLASAAGVASEAGASAGFASGFVSSQGASREAFPAAETSECFSPPLVRLLSRLLLRPLSRLLSRLLRRFSARCAAGFSSGCGFSLTMGSHAKRLFRARRGPPCDSLAARPGTTSSPLARGLRLPEPLGADLLLACPVGAEDDFLSLTSSGSASGSRSTCPQSAFCSSSKWPPPGFVVI